MAQAASTPSPPFRDAVPRHAMAAAVEPPEVKEEASYYYAYDYDLHSEESPALHGTGCRSIAEGRGHDPGRLDTRGSPATAQNLHGHRLCGVLPRSDFHRRNENCYETLFTIVLKSIKKIQFLIELDSEIVEITNLNSIRLPLRTEGEILDTRGSAPAPPAPAPTRLDGRAQGPRSAPHYPYPRHSLSLEPKYP